MSYRHWSVILILLIYISSFNRTEAQFGKNKVQYQDFKWKYIESNSVNVYYYDNAKHLADFTALKAEEALQKIQRLLNFRITNKINIIVYNTHNEFQQTNVISSYMPEGVGGVTELLKNRIVLPFMGDWEQFRHVIHHELIHAVINDMFYGGTVQSSLNTGTRVQLPLWMNEGLAEFSSLDGLDTQTDMFMRDLSLSEKLPELEELEDYLSYRGGQTFYWYVAEHYGIERIGDLLNRLKIYVTPNQAFQSSFSMSLEEFSKQWKKDLKRFYLPDIERFDDPEKFSERITDHTKDYNYYNSSPAISPDGSQMAYISDRDHVFGIWILDLDNKRAKPRELISSFRKQDFEQLNFLTPGISWAPEGKRLAVSAKSSGGEDAIFIVNVKKGDYDRLKFGLKSISSVTWSPDGFKLAFIAEQNAMSDVYLYDLRTKKIQNLTNDIYSDKNISWSIDSKTVFFISDRGDDLMGSSSDKSIAKKYIYNGDLKKSDIYSIDIETGKIKRLTYDSENMKTAIGAMPDGKNLLFVSDKNGIGNLYNLDLNSLKTKPKTNSLNGIIQFSFSRDGSRLLYSATIEGGQDIFSMKNPAEKFYPEEELPLTKLRQTLEDRKKIIANISTPESKIDSINSKPELTGYGNFKVDLTRQQLVRNNPDIQKNIIPDAPALKLDGSVDSMFVSKDYELQFTMDYIIANPGYSTIYGYQGVTQFVFSDLLGDNQIQVAADLRYDLKNSGLFVSYLYLPNRIDYVFSIFHRPGYIYIGNDLYRFRTYGGAFNAYYSIDMFNRIEWGVKLENLSKENIDVPQEAVVSKTLLVPEARFVHDDVLWGYMAPIRGTRYYAEIFGTPKFTDGDITFMNLNFDFRHYIPILGDYLNFTYRLSAGASLGPNPQRYYTSGTDNWINASFYNGNYPFTTPEDFEFMYPITPIRGFEVNERNGTQFFLTNFELRFPLFRALLPGPVPIVIQNIMGCFFFDMAGVWEGKFSDFRSTNQDIWGNLSPQDLLMSMGIGARGNVFGIPLKLDVAWKNNYSAWSEPFWLVSLGYDF